jgi:hypothetical protein
MAKFLNSHEIVAELSNLIRNSEEYLVIISPYLKIPNNFKILLKNLKSDCRIIYDSKNALHQSELDFLKTIKQVRLYKCNNLHVKCYINEKFGIIASMNLYEYSTANNWEMGILFSRDDDRDIYRAVLKEINSMKNNFEQQDSGIVKEIVDFVAGKAFCVRCKKSIDYNPQKPFCDGCYLKWVQFKNSNYIEQYCHGCGEHFKNQTITKANPLCKDCSKND